MIYAISDIHGQYNKFVELLNKIQFNCKDTLYILGDIIDRGNEIVKVVELVINTPNIKMILGNHEDMFLNYWETKGDYEKHLWYRNGGFYTDMEFSLQSEERIKQYVNYFKSLPIELELEIEGKRFLLVHGNYVDEKEKHFYTPDEYRMAILWNRVKKEDTGPKDKIVLFGHTSTDKYTGFKDAFTIWKNGNIIGLDCGMAKTSIYPNEVRLGCLCLNNMQEFYV